MAFSSAIQPSQSLFLHITHLQGCHTQVHLFPNAFLIVILPLELPFRLLGIAIADLLSQRTIGLGRVDATAVVLDEAIEHCSNGLKLARVDGLVKPLVGSSKGDRGGDAGGEMQGLGADEALFELRDSGRAGRHCGRGYVWLPWEF